MKKIKRALILFLFSPALMAFTLSNEGRVKLPSPEIKVIIASNTCTNAGFNSAEELSAMVKESVEKFWNAIPTCALELEVEGVNSGISTTSDTLLQALTKTPLGKILVGCSDDATLFSSSGTLGVGSINTASGDRGALLLNNRDTSFANQTGDEKLAIIAHEIGHAFGLGHSGDPAALMYYAIGGKVQERLSIDDYDACSWLHPHDSPGSCSGVIPPGGPGGWKGGSSGKRTLTSEKSPGNKAWWGTLFMGLGLSLVLVLVSRLSLRGWSGRKLS